MRTSNTTRQTMWPGMDTWVERREQLRFASWLAVTLKADERAAGAWLSELTSAAGVPG